MNAAWLQAFPMLAAEQAPLRQAAVALDLPAGAEVFAPGQPCTHFILICRGRVRVYQLGEAGDEIVLYRIGPGGICILTTLALLGADGYAAWAVAETPVAGVGIALPAFNALIAGSAAFRRFVFAFHAARLGDLMQVIQHVAFASIDTRLAARLLALGAGQPPPQGVRAARLGGAGAGHGVAAAPGQSAHAGRRPGFVTPSLTAPAHPAYMP